MKTIPLRLSEKNFALLHRFLGRADLKGHEVPEFLQLLQELRATPTEDSNAKSDRA
jgi:hypothetical protein